MQKDYNSINLIRTKTSSLSPNITNALVRMFNRLVERKAYASCLSTSTTLLIAFKYLGIDTKLVLGTLQYPSKISYFHSWLELDDKIIDIATPLDIKFHPILQDRGLEAKLEVYESYENSYLAYFPFQFGSLWEMADLKRVVGKSLFEYAEESTTFDIWSDVCYILDISATTNNLKKIQEIAKGIVIKDQ